LPTYTAGTSRGVSWAGIDPLATHSKVQCCADAACGTVLWDSDWIAAPTASRNWNGLSLGVKYYYRAQVCLQVEGTTVATSPWSNVVFSTQRSGDPTLTYTGDTTDYCGDPITLRAQLLSSGTPVEGNTVQFIVGGYSTSGVTGADGTASATVPENLLLPRTYTVYCHALAGQGYSAADAVGTLTVCSQLTSNTIVNGNGYFFRNGKRCQLQFGYNSSTATGSLTYLDYNSPLQKIVAGNATTVTLSPDGHTATVGGPCTVNGVATTFTLQVTDTTNTINSLTTASGYNVGPAALASGAVTFTH
jgi:hypothetical protein